MFDSVSRYDGWKRFHSLRHYRAWTSHWVQILSVRKEWKKPETENIITPDRKDLRGKMWHDLKNKDDSWDYVERAVSTALKEWILIEENWKLAKYDWYCYGSRANNDESIETMKRYLYRGCPIVRCLRWNKTTRTELSKWELKTIIPVTQRTWGHCIALVGWDKWWLRFVNSRTANDGKGMKSRWQRKWDLIKVKTQLFQETAWLVQVFCRVPRNNCAFLDTYF